MKAVFLACLLFGSCYCSSVAQEASPSPADKQIKIHVFGGVVNREGAYLVATGADILDAIKAADGLKDSAEGVWLYRGVINGHLRLLHSFRVRAVRDGTAHEVLMDGDYVVVREYNNGRF